MRRLGYWLVLAAVLLLHALPILAEGVDIVSGG